MLQTFYGRDYTGLEEEIRRQTFLQNLKFIERHNFDADSGLFSFWLSVNRYADQVCCLVATTKGMRSIPSSFPGVLHADAGGVHVTAEIIVHRRGTQV